MTLGPVNIGVAVGGLKSKPTLVTAQCLLSHESSVWAVRMVEQPEHLSDDLATWVESRVRTATGGMVEYALNECGDGRRTTDVAALWANRGPSVFLDMTGAGAPLLDDLTQVIHPTITVGCELSQSGQIVRAGLNRRVIGKRYLVARLQHLIQSGRLQLPENQVASQLVSALMSYEIRPLTFSDRASSEPFAIEHHEELVIALGLACQEEPHRVRALTWPGAA